MRFVVFGPAFGDPGDDVSVVYDVRAGDLIQFVRTGPTALELRRAEARPEQVYRLERGEEDGTIALYPVPSPELEEHESVGSQSGGMCSAGTATSGAEISSCGTYRYRLWRVWDASRPSVLFVGLNPSTADAELDDPTVRRCIGFAREWGFGGVEMANLFAFRATDPQTLLAASDPVGPATDAWLSQLRAQVPVAVAAWGAHSFATGRAEAVAKALSPLHCLGVTKDGHPRHPLYVKRGTGTQEWPA